MTSMTNPQPSKFAKSLLDLLRKAAADETFAPWTHADLIAARDYTLARLFPTGLAGAKQDMMVDQVTGGDPDKARETLRELVKPTLRRLRYKAQEDSNRRRRRAAMEAAGREWNADEDVYSEWIERIEESRGVRAKIVAAARKRGIPAVATERMDDDIFHSSVAFAGTDWADAPSDRGEEEVAPEKSLRVQDPYLRHEHGAGV